MINCRAFEDFIIDYLDGNLRWRERLVFRLHLLFCPACRAY
ncbi:MAG: zf-HC2 domain-containing protein, partial [Alphaproteobacteria bacterium]